jgi:NADH dehydrogenase
MSTPSPRTRVVVVGGGFAGAYCARRLEQRLRAKPVDVLLIDRHNYFVFHPLLVECGTGALQPRNAIVSIRSFLRRTRFIMGDVASIDLARSTIDLRTGADETSRTITYDHLVLAPGSTTLMPPIPGLREHAYEMKSLADAVSLRDRAVQLLEQAALTEDAASRAAALRFVVIGGGYTGVETAGEFHAYLRKAARTYRGIDPAEINLTLIDRGDRLIKQLDPRLSEYTRSHLIRRGIDVRLKTSVNSIELEACVLHDGTRLPTRTVVWCAGVAPSPLLRDIDLPTAAGSSANPTHAFRASTTSGPSAIVRPTPTPPAPSTLPPRSTPHAKAPTVPT